MMYRQVLFVVAFLLLAVCAFGQTTSSPAQSERVLVPANLLTAQQKSQADAWELYYRSQATTQEQIKTTGQYVGLGREIGIAMKEALEAITESATKFANTRLGTWTIFIVAYKIIGRDLTALIMGSFSVMIWLPIWLVSFYLFYIRKPELTDDEQKVAFERVRGYTMLGYGIALVVLIIVSAVIAI